MKHFRQLTAVFLLFALLCGCSVQKDAPATLPASGTPDASGEAPASSAPVAQPDTIQKQTENAVYHLEYQTLTLPAPLQSASALTAWNDRLLAGGLTDSGAVLTWMAPDGDSETVPLPDGADYLYALCPDADGGFWLLNGSLPAAYIDAGGYFRFLDSDPENRLALTRYDEACTIQESIPLTTPYTERFFQLLPTESGFCLLGSSLLVLLDSAGNELARQVPDAENGEWGYQSMCEADGTLFVLRRNLYGRSDGAELLAFAPDTFALTKPEPYVSDATGLGLCTDGRLLLNSKTALSALAPDFSETETLVSWAELGVSDTSEQLFQTGDGYLFHTPDTSEIALLRWVEGEAPVRTVLSLAVATNSASALNFEFGEMIRSFNLSQEQYRIDYTVYSDANHVTDAESADVLRTQIMAGQAPDLYAFYTTGYDAFPLNPESVCTDLLPLLGGDVTADTLLPNLYGLLTEDGALYQLPLTVLVDTMIAPSRLIPEPGVTLAELDEAKAQMPEGWVPIDSWNTPDNLFAAFCTAFCIGEYVDRTTATCNFETQGFYDYLKWCKEWGGDGSTPDAPERTLIKISYVAGVDQLAGRSEFVENTWFGEPGYTYAGFPNNTGSSGSAYRVLSSLGVSPQCRNLDAAKAFLKYCFGYSAQSFGLPASYPLLQSEMDDYMAGGRTDWRGDVEIISPADAEQFYDLLDSITILEGLDASLETILCEEASVYFSGGCTAEQAAKNIQSRANVYLSEQYG